MPGRVPRTRRLRLLSARLVVGCRRIGLGDLDVYADPLGDVADGIDGFDGNDKLYGDDGNLNGALDLNENDGDTSAPDDDRNGVLDPGILEYVTVWSREPTNTRTNVNDRNGLNSISKFTGTVVNINIRNFHTWGCPIYVLESKLQSYPKSLPKWDPRSKIEIYLGHSPVHAGNVALVLNSSTRHISLQYHVVFDDSFSIF